MANKRIIDLSAGNISSTNLAYVGDPSTGALTNVTYAQIKAFSNSYQKLVLSDASTTTWDFSVSPFAEWTITGNHTLNVINVPIGFVSCGVVNMIQGSGGNFTPVLSGDSSAVNYNFTAGTNNLLGFYFDGANMIWGSNYSGSGTTSGGGGGGGSCSGNNVLSALTYTASTSNLNPYFGGYIAGGGSTYALSNDKIASGCTSGYTQATWTGSGCDTAVLGLGSGDTLQFYATGIIIEYNYALYPYGGAYYFGEANEPPVSTGIVPIANDLYRLNKNGTTITADVLRTTASTWTTMHSFSATASNDLFIKASVVNTSNTLVNPHGYNMTST